MKPGFWAGFWVGVSTLVIIDMATILATKLAPMTHTWPQWVYVMLLVVNMITLFTYIDKGKAP